MMGTDDKNPVKFALRQFRLPIAYQLESRLLQFPAELRLATLRHLMLEPEAINVRTSREQGHEYSTQLLRCCQQLYKEGVHILYEENTLEVRCKTGNRNSCQYLRALNSYIQIPMWYEQIDIQSRSLRWWIENQKGRFIYTTKAAEEGSDEEENDDEANDDEANDEEAFYEQGFEVGIAFSDDDDGNRKSKFAYSHLNINPDKTEIFRRNIPAISNFSNLRVTMHSRFIQEFFIACRVLEAFVCGKVVGVSLRDRGDNHERADFLNACLNWRCKSLTILPDKQEPAVTSLNGTLIKRTFQDTLPVLHRIYFLNMGLSLSEPVANLHTHQEWHTFKDAVFQYKYEDAMALAHEILDYALHLIEQAEQVVEKQALAAQEQYKQLKLTCQNTSAGAWTDEDSDTDVEWKSETDEGRLALTLEVRDLVLDNAQDGRLAVQSVIDAFREMNKTHGGGLT